MDYITILLQQFIDSVILYQTVSFPDEDDYSK